MFLTSGNEMITKGGVLKPWYVYDVPENFIKTIPEINKHCLEISDKPQLYKKKYYAGCMKDGDSLCIKRLGGAGDVIWCLPVAKRIKELYPNSSITFWIGEHHYDLIKNNPYVDKCISNPSLKEVESFTWVLDYYESIERYNVAESQEAYDLHWKWAFNEELNISVIGNLFVSEQEQKVSAEIFGKDYIVVSMSSSNPKRTYFQMPIVIDRLLKEYDCNIIITGQGGFEVPKNPRIKNLLNALSLRELFAIIKNARLLIASDSGNLHFAGQLGIKAVGLYSTAHAKTRDKHYGALVSYQSPLWCAPCVKLGEPCPHEPECLSCITPDKVMTLIKEAY